MTEFRRILLDGYPLQVERVGEELVAPDGRKIAIKDAVHLAPSEPTKIVAVHLNYDSRTKEFMTKLPPAPTYFLKPTTALNSHKAAVVRPEGCKWLNYEGEIVIIIGKTCRNISPEEAGDYIARLNRAAKCRGATEQHVARDQSDGARDVGHQVVHIPFHVVGVVVLNDLAVHNGLDSLVAEIPIGDHARANRRKGV